MTFYIRSLNNKKVNKDDLVIYENEKYKVIKHPKKDILGIQYYDDPNRFFRWIDIYDFKEIK